MSFKMSILSIRAFFLNTLKKYKLKVRIEKIRSYMEVGDSFFYYGFRLLHNNRKFNHKPLKIGDNNILDCVISLDSSDSKVIIGNNNWIGSSNFFCKTKFEIGDNVFISWGCFFSDHDSHSIDYAERQNDIIQQLENFKNGENFLKNKNWDVVKSFPIQIHSNVWIGMNCIILKGVTIGEGAIVAAGSVVTKNIPSWTVYGGNPANFIKDIPLNMRRQCEY